MLPEFFNDPTLARFLTALAVIAAGLLAYRLVGYVTLARARSRFAIIEPQIQGTPVLLYFTTPTCAPCKTVQRPAIRRLQEMTGDHLQVVEIDASAQPDLASQWGVMSVPTTFIIDASGAPRHINYGVASTEKLLQQFRNVLESTRD
jgi:thiol-disulfide isomerase/thioredoxin